MQPMDDFYATSGIGKDQFNDVLINADHGRRQDDGRALRQPRLAAVVQHEGHQGRRA